MKKFLLFLPMIIFAQVIRFSPLPTDTIDNLYTKYEPLLKYLSKKTGDEYKFVYSPTYKVLLDNFKSGKVDLITLGALPYLRLKEEFIYIKPIVTFLNKYKKPYYTCQIITSDNNINSLDDISMDTTVFLTNKLSTCGYLMTQYMFKKANKDLEEYNYKYVGNHVNVVYNVTLYNNAIGDVKSSIAKEYSHFVRVIDTSIRIPGFSLFVNTQKLSKKQIKKITDSLKHYVNVIITPKDFYKPIEKIREEIKVQ